MRSSAKALTRRAEDVLTVAVPSRRSQSIDGWGSGAAGAERSRVEPEGRRAGHAQAWSVAGSTVSLTRSVKRPRVTRVS